MFVINILEAKTITVNYFCTKIYRLQQTFLLQRKSFVDTEKFAI